VNLDARVLLFGLIPAFQISRLGSGFRQNKFRLMLFVSEIAIAVVLVIGAALLIRTRLALQSVQPARLHQRIVFTMRVSLAAKQYAVERLGRPRPFHGGGSGLTIGPGRFDDDRNSGPARQVSVINEPMAKQFWPDKNPLLHRILLGKGVMPALETEQLRQASGLPATDVRTMPPVASRSTARDRFRIARCPHPSAPPASTPARLCATSNCNRYAM